MDIWPILAMTFAGLEVLAVRNNWHRFKWIAKPAVMICLFLWLFFATGLQGNMLWFGVGLVFSLLGDMLLLIPQDRMFIPGVIAFSLTHISYLIGLQEQLLDLTAWSLILLFFIFLNGIRLLRRIVSSLRAKGQNGLVTPVIVYGLVISLMLYAAMSTMFDPAWETAAAFYTSAGAFLFWLSDLLLAWNKFVSPLQNGPVFTTLMYSLGQIGLIAGMISQFS